MIDDAELKQLVLDELQWDPKVDHAHIGVAATEGAVSLSGHVFSYASKYAAVEAVKRVNGVKAISDEIEVNLPTEHRRDDAEIARHLAHVLEWNVSAPGNTVKATVSDGVVTLSGSVESQHQRDHIEDQITHVGSISGIRNRIALKPKANEDDVKKQIEDALKRSAEVEASSVDVAVRGDTVVLRGAVKALYERGLIEKAAWAAPGVKHVEDHIQIG